MAKLQCSPFAVASTCCLCALGRCQGTARRNGNFSKTRMNALKFIFVPFPMLGKRWSTRMLGDINSKRRCYGFRIWMDSFGFSMISPACPNIPAPQHSNMLVFIAPWAICTCSTRMIWSMSWLWTNSRKRPRQFLGRLFSGRKTLYGTCCKICD